MTEFKLERWLIVIGVLITGMAFTNFIGGQTNEEQVNIDYNESKVDRQVIQAFSDYGEQVRLRTVMSTMNYSETVFLDSANRLYDNRILSCEQFLPGGPTHCKLTKKGKSKAESR